MLQVFRALSAVLALVAISLVSALITMRLAIHGAEVRVPSLTGLTVPAVVERLHEEGLEVAIDGHFYSTTQPAGHVLTQSPEPGTLVRKSWRVRVTESLGQQKTAIPAVDGMDENLATISIRRIGLQVKSVASIPDAYALENTVIAQTPLARATDVQGPRVSILLATTAEPDPVAYVMPDLTGETFTAAALTVVHAGFKLAPLQNHAQSRAAPTSSATGAAGAATVPQGSSTTVPTATAAPSVPSGTVIGQMPPAGTLVIPETMIQMTVQP